MKALTLCCCLSLLVLCAHAGASPSSEPLVHSDSADWPELFEEDLSNAVNPNNIWTVENGELTASEDRNIWTKKEYDNFILDLEFKNGEETNSGVIVYCSNVLDWIPNSVEIQIADDHAKKWAESPKSWQCAAIFGHLPASKSVVKAPGEWNRMTVRCVDKHIDVTLNGEHVTSMNMDDFTSATVNPDGSEIPSWLNKPKSTLPTRGRIGFQGKHGGAPIWFRNIRIKELE